MSFVPCSPALMQLLSPAAGTVSSCAMSDSGQRSHCHRATAVYQLPQLTILLAAISSRQKQARVLVCTSAHNCANPERWLSPEANSFILSSLEVFPALFPLLCHHICSYVE